MTIDSRTGDRIGGIETSMLVAYVDGVLPPEQARELESAIRDNSEAQEALSLMRQSAAAARHAFDAPLGEPVPERLRSLFDRRANIRASLSQWLLPLAASIVALVVGLAGGYLMGRQSETGSAIQLAAGPATTAPSAFDAALLQALTGNLPSVEYTDTARGTTGAVTLLSPIDTSFGVVCREFRHVAKDRQARTTTGAGLACRRGDGGWEVTILTAIPS